VFIEFIISGNTSYTYWFVFISPLDDKKKILHILYLTKLNSLKQVRVIVCFNMLSFSSMFTQYQLILLTWDT
jgi:hypothetical protein